MTKFLKFLFFVTIFDTTNSYATTWDEPWADKVIKEASVYSGHVDPPFRDVDPPA